MTLPHPIVHHPFVVSLGPLQLTGFGIAILMCFVIGQVVAQRELARRGHDAEPVNDMIFAAVLGGLLGAKLYYVVVLRHWDAIFDRGGFVFWGGLLGGTLAVLAVVRRRSASACVRIFDVGGPRVRGGVRGGPHGLLGRRRRLRPSVEGIPRRRVSRRARRRRRRG